MPQKNQPQNLLKDFTKSRVIPTTIDVSSDEARDTVLTQMSQLRSHPGWKMIYADLISLINQTEGAIFTVGSNEVIYSERDLLILFHGFMNAVLNRPDYIISLLKQQTSMPMEEADPFA